MRTRLGILLALLLASPAHAQWSSSGVLLSTGHGWSGGTQSPRAISDGAGGAILAWSDASAVWLQRVTAAGTIAPGWPADGLLASTDLHGPLDQVSPSLTTDGAGGAIVVWRDHRRNQDAIYGQRVSPGGVRVWPDTGLAISRPPIPAQVQAPYATIADSFGVLVAWSDDRTGSMQPYAMRVRGNGAFAPGWTAEGNALCPSAVNAVVHSIVSDVAGGAFVTWRDDRDSPAIDIYVQHVSRFGSLSPNWTAAGTLVCSATGLRTFPDAVADSAQGAFLVFPDKRNNVDSDVYAARVHGGGALPIGWTTSGFPVSAMAGNQGSVANDPTGIASAADGTGGVLVAWHDDRNGADDIYAGRVTGAGALAAGWTPDGTPVSTAPGAQSFPAVTTDGAGGMIVAWMDRRNGTDFDVYATRLLANGAVAPGWTPGGTAVCAFPGDQGQVAIERDGAGGAIVAWFDARRGDPDHPDVYAGRVQNDGAVPTLPSLLRAVVEDGTVRVTWFAAGAGPLAIERSAGGAAWSRVATGSADGDGWLVYEDPDVAPGVRYGYRLARDSGLPFAEAWVDVPGLAFALAPPRANPAHGAIEASFTLPDGAPARLELIAASGRRVALREVGGLGAGTHRVDLVHGVALAPGMYFERLVRGSETRVRRVAYLPD